MGKNGRKVVVKSIEKNRRKVGRIEMGKNRRKVVVRSIEKNRRKVGGKRNNGVDMISKLPDDILVSIISRLTVAEAVATSVLSTRWRHLYTYITRLSFSLLKKHIKLSTDEVYEYPRYEELTKEEYLNYVDTINHTLDSHNGGKFLEEFRICLPRYERLSIEWLLEFALAKEVQVIDISAIHNFSHGIASFSIYPSLSTLISEYIRLSLPGFKSLKELYLCSIEVYGKDVQLLLSSFTALERLSIECSYILNDVIIIGDSTSKLKHLDIHKCCIDSLHIDNLVSLESLSFALNESPFDLMLHNVPKLTEFSTGAYTIEQIFSAGIHDQFVNLKLSGGGNYKLCEKMNYPFPKLTNVKHMEVEANMCNGCGSHQLFQLIEACPCLQKLEIKLSWFRHIFFLKDFTFKKREVCEYSSGINTPNHHLKKVKLLKYSSSASEFKFVSRIVRKAVALEELIVETCGKTFKIQERVRAHAKQQFRPIIPNSVNLVII